MDTRMTGRLIILGCGASAGVPTIGNWWGACDPNEPKNRRTRPSIALQTENTLIIVDTGPDFREQMNRESLGCPDAIIITHTHADHINGIDELRLLQRRHKRKFPVYAMEETMPDLTHRAGYMFEDRDEGFYPAACEAITVNLNMDQRIGDIAIHPFRQNHGTINSLGLRISTVGYSTDVKRLDDSAIGALQGIRTWIVDGAGHDSPSNPVHFSVSEVAEMATKIGNPHVILTHLPPTMDYGTMKSTLPENMVPAHDGMVIPF